jgi:hypothetical protein
MQNKNQKKQNRTKHHTFTIEEDDPAKRRKLAENDRWRKIIDLYCV